MSVLFYHGTIDLSGNYAMVVQYRPSSISYGWSKSSKKQDMTKYDTVILLHGIAVNQLVRISATSIPYEVIDS